MQPTLTQKTTSVILIAFIFALILRIFVIEGFFVSGESMHPTLRNGDYIFIYKLAYLNQGPQRHEIVVAYPRQYSTKVVKRVAVLPREVFEPIPGRRDRLDPGEYYLIGDNLTASIDSRVFGPVDRWDIEGRVIGAFRIKDFKYIDF